MIRSNAPSRWCVAPLRASRRAFTLIELLTVMAIILVLAGLILSIAGSVNYKASVSRATAEIKQMETALDGYKIDNGAYPRDTSATLATDTLNAQTSDNPSAYTASSRFLFTELSGILTTAANPKKAYVTFLPGQLSPTPTASNPPASGTTYIIDPFGFSYGYSTINQAGQDKNAATPGSVDMTTAGFNPTFDLWSTAGYSTPGGKAYPTDMVAAKHYTLWAKNW